MGTEFKTGMKRRPRKKIIREKNERIVQKNTSFYFFETNSFLGRINNFIQRNADKDL